MLSSGFAAEQQASSAEAGPRAGCRGEHGSLCILTLEGCPKYRTQHILHEVGDLPGPRSPEMQVHCLFYRLITQVQYTSRTGHE